MGNKSKTPNPGGWGTSQFLNTVYGKINMSAIGKDNIYKAAKKVAGIVVFALIVNTVGKYTIKRRLLAIYDAAIAGKLFLAGTAGILAMEVAMERFPMKSG